MLHVWFALAAALAAAVAAQGASPHDELPDGIDDILELNTVGETPSFFNEPRLDFHSSVIPALLPSGRRLQRREDGTFPHVHSTGNFTGLSGGSFVDYRYNVLVLNTSLNTDDYVEDLLAHGALTCDMAEPTRVVDHALERHDLTLSVTLPRAYASGHEAYEHFVDRLRTSRHLVLGSASVRALPAFRRGGSCARIGVTQPYYEVASVAVHAPSETEAATRVVLALHPAAAQTVFGDMDVMFEWDPQAEREIARRKAEGGLLPPGIEAELAAHRVRQRALTEARGLVWTREATLSSMNVNYDPSTKRAITTPLRFLPASLLFCENCYAFYAVKVKVAITMCTKVSVGWYTYQYDTEDTSGDAYVYYGTSYNGAPLAGCKALPLPDPTFADMAFRIDARIIGSAGFNLLVKSDGLDVAASSCSNARDSAISKAECIKTVLNDVKLPQISFTAVGIPFYVTPYLGLQAAGYGSAYMPGKLQIGANASATVEAGAILTFHGTCTTCLAKNKAPEFISSATSSWAVYPFILQGFNVFSGTVGADFYPTLTLQVMDAVPVFMKPKISAAFSATLSTGRRVQEQGSMRGTGGRELQTCPSGSSFSAGYSASMTAGTKRAMLNEVGFVKTYTDARNFPSSWLSGYQVSPDLSSLPINLKAYTSISSGCLEPAASGSVAASRAPGSSASPTPSVSPAPFRLQQVTSFSLSSFALENSTLAQSVLGAINGTVGFKTNSFVMPVSGEATGLHISVNLTMSPSVSSVSGAPLALKLWLYLSTGVSDVWSELGLSFTAPGGRATWSWSVEGSEFAALASRATGPSGLMYFYVVSPAGSLVGSANVSLTFIPAPTPSPTPSATPSAASGTVVRTSSFDVSTMLVDNNTYTDYLGYLQYDFGADAFRGRMGWEYFSYEPYRGAALLKGVAVHVTVTTTPARNSDGSPFEVAGVVSLSVSDNDDRIDQLYEGTRFIPGPGGVHTFLLLPEQSAEELARWVAPSGSTGGGYMQVTMNATGVSQPVLLQVAMKITFYTGSAVPPSASSSVLPTPVPSASTTPSAAPGAIVQTASLTVGTMLVDNTTNADYLSYVTSAFGPNTQQGRYGWNYFAYSPYNGTAADLKGVAIHVTITTTPSRNSDGSPVEVAGVVDLYIPSGQSFLSEKMRFTPGPGGLHTFLVVPQQSTTELARWVASEGGQGYVSAAIKTSGTPQPVDLCMVVQVTFYTGSAVPPTSSPSPSASLSPTPSVTPSAAAGTIVQAAFVTVDTMPVDNTTNAQYLDDLQRAFGPNTPSGRIGWKYFDYAPYTGSAAALKGVAMHLTITTVPSLNSDGSLMQVAGYTSLYLRDSSAASYINEPIRYTPGPGVNTFLILPGQSSTDLARWVATSTDSGRGYIELNVNTSGFPQSVQIQAVAKITYYTGNAVPPSASGSATPTPTRTSTPTSSSSSSPSLSPTPSGTSTGTPTPSQTPSGTSTGTPTPTASVSKGSSATPTPTPSVSLSSAPIAAVEPVLVSGTLTIGGLDLATIDATKVQSVKAAIAGSIANALDVAVENVVVVLSAARRLAAAVPPTELSRAQPPARRLAVAVSYTVRTTGAQMNRVVTALQGASYAPSAGLTQTLRSAVATAAGVPAASLAVVVQPAIQADRAPRLVAPASPPAESSGSATTVIAAAAGGAGAAVVLLIVAFVIVVMRRRSSAAAAAQAADAAAKSAPKKSEGFAVENPMAKARAADALTRPPVSPTSVAVAGEPGVDATEVDAEGKPIGERKAEFAPTKSGTAV